MTAKARKQKISDNTQNVPERMEQRAEKWATEAADGGMIKEQTRQ